MKILCTFPGKFGDLLWALPTIRAISRRIGEPVHLRVAARFAGIVPLLQQQPYLGSVKAYLDWGVQDTAPISPRLPPQAIDEQSGGWPLGYAVVLHLGYRSWPLPDVVRHTLETANDALTQVAPGEWDVFTVEDLALDEPWITAGARANFIPFNPRAAARIAVGFTDEHFELKYGVTLLMDAANYTWAVTPIGRSPRWDTEGSGGGLMNWEETLGALQAASVFLGCCSALHVLAVAAGVPVVLMEPAEARWNPVFYPLGQDGPRVWLVKGTNHLPTFDARHVRDTLEQVLATQKELTR